MAQTPAEVFSEKKHNYSAQEATLSQKTSSIAIIRIAVFLTLTIAAIYLANERSFYAFGGIIVIFPFAFGAIVNWHNRIKLQLQKLKFLHSINITEERKLAYQLRGLPTKGLSAEEHHPYAIDLDILGENSLFQLLDRTSLDIGAQKLAEWLLHPAAKTEIEERQQAVGELDAQIEWRQELQANGLFASDKQDISGLQSWLKEDFQFLSRKIWISISRVFPVLSLVNIIAVILGFWTWQFLIGTLLINGLLLRPWLRTLLDIHKATELSLKPLAAMERMILQIEDTSFQSKKLKCLQNHFSGSNTKASKAIGQLKKHLDFFDNRSNAIYHLFNALFLVDLWILSNTEKWKQRYQNEIDHWLEALAEFEAINSLSGFSFAHPDYSCPKIIDQKFELNGTTIGHPLIPKDKRITNDFEIFDDGAVALITGSNMSGKSTFLRTIGLNAVLSFVGAPVCAHTFTISRIDIFTSMRTQDNLEESVSSFYAELRRLKQLIDQLKRGTPTLFLLDEILKGTNSEDRHKGAVGLIHQLSKLKAFGLVSTHDLALSKMASDSPQITNYSFNSIIEDRQIFFDYRLTDGPCKSFNASQLMKNMGIEVDES